VNPTSNVNAGSEDEGNGTSELTNLALAYREGPPTLVVCVSAINEATSFEVITHYLRQGSCVFIDVSWFVSLFVCLLAGLRKNYLIDFTKFGGKVAYGPQQKPLSK